MSGQGKTIYQDYLIIADKNGDLLLGRDCFSHFYGDSTTDLVLRSPHVDGSVVFEPGAWMTHAATGKRTNVYNLALSVKLPEGSEIPPEENEAYIPEHVVRDTPDEKEPVIELEPQNVRKEPVPFNYQMFGSSPDAYYKPNDVVDGILRAREEKQ